MFDDLSNQRFGNLVVLFFVGNNRHGAQIWHCRCDCGAEKDVLKGNLTGGYTKSCGNTSNHKYNFLGRRFGKLLVIGFYGKSSSRGNVWLCQCDCGATTKVKSRHLIEGEVRSCGCTKTRISVGDTFGKWTVIEYSCSVKAKKGTCIYWWCQCECGKVKEIRANILTSGSSTQCRRCSRTTHGMSHIISGYPPEYSLHLRRRVRHRDNSTCQLCGVNPQNGKLDIHHIDKNRLHNEMINLVVLCDPCHHKMHGKDSDEWVSFWQAFMKEKYGND